MNPAVITKKTSVTATNTRSPIIVTRCLLLRFPPSEALWLHEGIEQVDREAGGAEASEPDHCGSGHG